MAAFSGSLLASLERLVRRHFWIIILNLLSVSAFLHARGIDALVALRLSPDATHLANTPDAPPEVRPVASAREGRSAAVILARNAFDSVTGSLREHAKETLSVGLEATPLDNPMAAPECEGVRVVAIAASADPDWSLASFMPSEAASPVLRRRGGGFDGKTVSFIGRDRVWLVDKRGLCQASMWKAPPPPPANSANVGEKPTPRSALVKELALGIRRLGPTAFSIDRSVVEKILEHQAVMLAGSQIVPDETSGRAGFRVSGVKPDSLIAMLGVQSGDHLEMINGLDVTNPETALEAYARLRQAPRLTLTVNRNGKVTNIDYDIQP